MLSALPRIALSLLPVLAFALALYWLDSFRLVAPRALATALLAGVAAALACLVLDHCLGGWLNADPLLFRRYLAPVLEEAAKAAYVILLLRRRRLGFAVDAAITGFAVGTGFALVENIDYLRLLGPASPMIWIIRGFGTAVMHGAVTAIFAIMAKSRAERSGRAGMAAVLPGLVAAMALHSLYNHVFLNPVLATMAIVVAFPALIAVTFERSEHALRQWMEAGFAGDTELLAMLNSGTFLQSPSGRYLRSLSERLPGEVLADMLCYLRNYVELAIRAKAVLLARENGIYLPNDGGTAERFAELRFLERTIGPIGRRLLSPLMHTSPRDLWQIHMLQGGHSPRPEA
jgi:RsiW-degrading membrane proteinase PrsW (M82 family)